MEGSRHCVLRKEGGYAGPRGIESLMAVTSNLHDFYLPWGASL